jgi:tetratricopeptide (TPR) repeat protein
MNLLHLVALAAAAGSPQTPETLPLFLYRTQPHDEARSAEAWGLLRRMSTYLQVNYPQGGRPRVYLEAFGGETTAHWFRPYEDLAERLRFEVRGGRDSGWRALRDESEALFEGWPGSDRYVLPIGGARLEGGLRPFRELRVAQAVPSKVAAARRHARDVVEYLELHYPAIDAAAYSADLHEPQAIYWLIDYYDLSSWEAVRAELLDDDAYLALEREGEDLFLAEGAIDKMLVDYEFDWSSSVAHLDQAEALRRAGDLLGAATCYRRTLEIDPNLAQAAHLLGHVLEELGDEAGAIDGYRRWSEMLPLAPMSLRDLAWVLATTPDEDLRDLDQALQLTERAIELDPGVSLFWLTLGVCRYRTGDFPGCVEALERSIELDGSGDPYEWLFLAMAHQRLGDEARARDWYARSLDWVAEHGPDPEYTRYSLRRKAEMGEFLAEARGVLGIEPGGGQ